MTFRDLCSTKFVYRHRSKKMSIAFVLLLVGCLLFNSIPDAFGFIPFFNLKTIDTLTKRLHKDTWVIRYIYVDDCPEELIKEDAFPEAVTIALQTWLQPLREYTDRPIVNDFRVERYAGPPNDFREPNAGPDLYCIIYGPTTDVERSHASVIRGSGPLVGILVRHSKELNPLFKHELLHEVGHAFGLGDVYITGWNVSTGGLVGTAGKHPASIMAAYMLSGDFSGNLWTLGRDDQLGVIWLYKHIHEGISRKACETIFPDYHYTESPNSGCEPKHPLLDALKYHTEYIVAKMLREDENLEVSGQDAEGMTPLLLAMLKGYWEIAGEVVSRLGAEDLDVNVRDPKTGNTPLHLAVLDNNTDFVKKLLAHPKIKVNIHNKETRTPAQLARHLKRFPLTKLIWEHPTAKFLPWSVPSKRKLATTWGHLKKQY